MAIVLVAGGENQISLAKHIKDKGYELIVVDPNDEPPCLILADIHIKIDIRFHLDILPKLEELNIAIDGVISDQSDAALETVSILSSYYQLPHIQVSKIRRCIDKLSQFVLLSDNDVPLPVTMSGQEGDQQSMLSKVDEMLESYSNIVIKPADSQGSKGVSIANNKQEAYDGIQNALAYSSQGKVLLQQYITGFEYSLDGVRINGEFFPLVCARKFHYKSNPCIDERNTFLSDVPESIIQKIVATTKKAIDALDIKDSLFHAEVIIDHTTEICYLIEISPRGGGGSISSKIVPAITGFSSNEFLLQRCIGGELKTPDKTVFSEPESFIIMRFFPEIIGEINEVRFSSPVNSKIIHHESPQFPITGRGISNSRDRLGYWVIASSDRDLLVSDEKYMVDSMQVL